MVKLGSFIFLKLRLDLLIIFDYLKLEQEVFVQVVDYDEYSGKASLSTRTLEEKQQKIPRHHRFTNERYKIGFAPLAKHLPTWIKETKEFLDKTKKA